MDQEVWTSANAGRLDSEIAAHLDEISRSRAAQLIRDGCVRVGGQEVRKPSFTVRRSEEISVTLPPPFPIDAVPQNLPVSIVYQDKDLVVVNKSAGMVVHPAAGHPDGTLVNALLHHIGDLSGIGGALRPGIVHRLDKGTSGLMVVAKNDRTHQALAEQFATKTAGRRYLALCHGLPSTSRGTIRSRLARHPTQRKRWASTESGGKHAVTHWSLLGEKGTVFLAECVLETGRTHQIRVHMTESGWPLVGDGVYKRRNTRVPASITSVVDPSGQRPMLHAWSLTLVHPQTQARCVYTAKPPDDMMSCLEALELQSYIPNG